MKKIVVPVDFSEHSEYALETAASLARAYNAPIVVLHMLGLSDAFYEEDDGHDEAEARYFLKRARERFSTFLDKPYLSDIEVTEIVQNYKIFSEIGEVAREQEAGLIVMGSHGAGGMLEIFVGSHTEKVVRTSDIPVLVVKKRMPEFTIRRVVYAMDFKPQHLQAYLNAMTFFGNLKAEVHLVHVNLPNFQFLSTTQISEMAEAFFKKADTGEPEHHQAFVADYSVEQGLYNYADTISADLIAVPTHGRSGLAHFFRGSIGEDVANHAPLPVLTFKV